MPLPRRLALVATTAALGLALTSCSGGDDGLDYEDSPLNAYLSAGTDTDVDEDAWIEQAQADDLKREEAIAVCMTELGFEYTPFTGNYGYSSSSDGEEWKPDDRDWVSQYGYGAINYPGKDEDMAVVPEDEVETNPNDEYVSSLSESESTAYYEALNGPQPPEEAYEDENYDWDAWYEDNGQGCWGDAQESLDEVAEDPWSQEEFQPLVEAMTEFYDGVYSSPEVAELDAEWASCMADGGHAGFAKREEAQNSIYDEQNAFWEEQNAEYGDEMGSWTEEEWADFEKETESARKAFEDELAEKEIALALVDLDCREKVDYDDELLRIQFEKEEQFVQDHKAELEAYKAAAEQAS
ncbi:fimbrillin family protein [Microbacterium marinilacus]|nr:fimbrillin family protein [Microbacterium marinilacus]MBY0689874.1 fimbrillin family protein [Microbacterium marinilacus]